MATSSIFASFDIRDRKTAEKFVEALEESAHDSTWKPMESVRPPMTDKDMIRALWSKRSKT